MLCKKNTTTDPSKQLDTILLLFMLAAMLLVQRGGDMVDVFSAESFTRIPTIHHAHAHLL